VATDLDRVDVDPDQASRQRHRHRFGFGHAQLGAEDKGEVGRPQEIADGVVALPEVAERVRVVLRDGALAELRGDDRRPEPLGQRDQTGGGVRRDGAAAGVDDDLVRRLDRGDRLGDGLRRRTGLGNGPGRGDVEGGLLLQQVARDFDVGGAERPALIERNASPTRPVICSTEVASAA
jgi:hypothetical protein